MKLNSNKLKKVVQCILMLSVVLSYSQNINEEDLQSIQIGTLYNEYVDPNYNEPSSLTENAISYIKLKINDDIIYNNANNTNNAFTAIFTFHTFLLQADGIYSTQETINNLEINYNPVSGIAAIQDQAFLGFKGSRGYKTKIEQAVITDSNGNTINTIPNNIELYFGFKSNYYKALSPIATTITATEVTATNELEFSWQPVTGAINYQLEWTWVDGYDELTTGLINPSLIDFSTRDFQLNSTRIQTSGTTYKIPLIYDKGYIIYRVRAAGVSITDTNINVYNTWSSGTSNKVTVADWDKYTLTTSHEAIKNWQFQASYAEEGKKKEVVSYFDGTLRNRQTVTKINSDDNAIVGEVIYDNQGRPAIEVLPVPANNNKLQFYPDFNLNTSGEVYTHHDFDWSPVGQDFEVDTNAMGATSGASAYYGANAPANAQKPFQDFVPNAEGFPFSQIQYMPDNTGRIKAKGGVGPKHQINYANNQGVQQDHEMRYFYTTPAQEELNRLFGENVGNFVHYKKNIVIDPNGQVSVSYIDPQGRTIATALAGESPTNLEALEDVANGNHGSVTVDLLGKANQNDADTDLDNNIKQSSGVYGSLEDMLVMSKQIISTQDNSSINFNYNLSSTDNTYTVAGCNIVYPFVYDLTVALFDESGENKLLPPLGTIVVGGLTNGLPYTYSPDATLPIGTYQLNKTLKINEEVLNTHLETYIASITTEGGACYIPPINPVDAAIGCFEDCDDCLTNLGELNDHVLTELALYYDNSSFSLTSGNSTATGSFEGETVTLYWNDNVNQPINTNEIVLAIQAKIAGYKLLAAACNYPCQDETLNNALTLSSCTVYDTVLREDMAPGGQYGAIAESIEDPLSIYNENNSLLYRNANGIIDIQNNNWRNPIGGIYLDALGQEAKVFIIPIEDENGIITGYNPPIQDNVTIATTALNEQWVKPQELANVADFIDLMSENDSWLDALVGYHPEYCYLEYTTAVCELQKKRVHDYLVDQSNYNPSEDDIYVDSDGYDSYIRSINTFAQANSTNIGLFTSETSLLAKDPYFDSEIIILGNVSDKRALIMEEALNDEYENTNHTILELAYVSITSLPNTNVNFNTVANLTSTAQKDQIWQLYKGLYLGLKAKINSAFANAYAKRQGCYNVCIQDDQGDYNVSELDTIANEIINYNAAADVTTYANGGVSNTQQICSTDYAGYFTNKEKRFKAANGDVYSYANETDFLNNSGSDYQSYTQTGNCPLLFDFEYFFNGFITQHDANNTPYNFTTGTVTYFGNYITPDFINAITGTTGGAFPNGSTFTTTITNNIATVSTGGNQILTIQVPQEVADLNMDWSNYNPSGTTGWYFTGAYNPYYDAINSNLTSSPLAFAYQMNAVVVINNNPVDTIIAGHTPVAIGECSSPGTTDTNGNGNTSVGDTIPAPDETGGFFNTMCEDKENFEISIRNLLNTLNENTQLDDATVDLSTIDTYINDEFLPSYINDIDKTAIWKNNTSNYTIERNGQELIKLNISFPDIGGNGAIDHLLSVQLTSIDNTNYGTITVNYLSGNDSIKSVSGALMPAIDCGCGVSTCSINLLDGTFDGINITTSNNGCYNAYIIGSGWQFETGSIDSYNPLFNNCTQLGASPQGGNYVSGLFIESISKQLNDLEIGAKYVISFYQANHGLVGDSNNNYENPALTEVTFGDEVQTSPLMPYLGFKNAVWEKVVLIFTATNTTQKLILNPRGLGDLITTKTYVALDGVEVAKACVGESGDIINTICDTCIPQTVAPIVCNPAYNLWYGASGMNFAADANGDIVSNKVAGYYFTANYERENFCNMNFAHLVNSYLYYLDTLNITDVSHAQFLTLAEFGDTDLNYGYNDINTVIVAFNTFTGNSAYANESWNTYVDAIYLPSNPSICPPAPMRPNVNITIDPNTIDNECETFSVNVAETYATDIYTAYIETLKENFKTNYINKAMETAVEQFTETYSDKEYQYTLYYYDQAGNLRQTVAPEGVNRLEGTVTTIDHDFETQYKYNSLNQLVWQSTPDGGITRFAYDNLGRIIASQNAKQIKGLATNTPISFSYTTYDGIGRITEAGEVTVSSLSSDVNGTYTISDEGRLISVKDQSDGAGGTTTVETPVNGFTLENYTRAEVTHTVYDAPLTISAIESSNNYFDGYNTTIDNYNLRNRVAGVLYYNTVSGAIDHSAFNNAIFYVYDIHGNVKEMVNVNKEIPISDTSEHIKHIAYNYDLISGNVNEVVYQKDRVDQFIHRYAYDADNRITQVETSNDGLNWEKEAGYKYYDHGPLARVEFGDKKVQGTDYVYTLQGWLKGVNSESLKVSADVGFDGSGTRANTARDAYGYTLNYFDNDYTARNTVTNSFDHSTVNPSTKNLYNGNIKQMTSSMRNLSVPSTGTQNTVYTSANKYTYDQLNRIKNMNGTLVDRDGSSQTTRNDVVKSNYAYDKNGNLLSLSRWAFDQNTNQSKQIDNFTYKYLLDPTTGTVENNQLGIVLDAQGEQMGTDLNDQFTVLNNLGIVNTSVYDNANPDHQNYVYDEIGQLVEDKSEGLTIDWRVDGKVKSVTKTNGDVITFLYDGLGNRIAKKVHYGNSNGTGDAKATYYSRDAQGNVLSVYNLFMENDGIVTQPPSETNVQLPNATVTTTETIQALNTIENPNSYIVQNTGNVTLEAGTRITLKPGFKATSGTTFKAKITNFNAIEYNEEGFTLKEHHIFGSSRLGLQEYTNVVLDGPEPTNTTNILELSRKVGDKRYELSNHLGNVLTVITDRKLPNTQTNTGDVSLFTPEVIAFNDYYPFGMLMPNRNAQSDNYRYGFQGQERDDEVKGNGNSLNYRFRMHDPRVGRFFATDPLEPKYPYLTPYQFSSNQPIHTFELEGLESNNELRSSISPFEGDYGEFDSIASEGGSTPISKRLTLDLNIPNYSSLSWEADGKTYTQVTGNTLVIGQVGAATEAPKYGFILPQSFGSWGETGSDGRVWIGCMSCHGNNGAYRYASYNSQERLAGHLLAFILDAGTPLLSYSFNSTYVYRGTRKYTELVVADELGGYVLSDAARIRYLETGDLKQSLKYADEVHQKWLKIFDGDINKYAKAHTLEGTELAKKHNLPRTLISVTTDEATAIKFSKGGTVFEGNVLNSKIINSAVEGSTESEKYIINAIKFN